MAWIKLETHTFDKVEVFSIAQELGIDPDSVVGKCCRVWAWFDANTTDGVTKSVTTALLDRYCGVTGFSKAMVNVGWMVLEDENLYLPNYDRHNSQTAKDRALGAKRAAKHKKNKDLGISKSNATTNDEPLAKSKIEKIREDKNIYTIEFESFWKSYDKPAGKANAFKVWKSIKPDSELQALILQKATLQTKNVERKFRKDAERWLRDKRWEDEISVVKQVSNFDEMMRSAK
jgi:hypothetical protein